MIGRLPARLAGAGLLVACGCSPAAGDAAAPTPLFDASVPADGAITPGSNRVHAGAAPPVDSGVDDLGDSAGPWTALEPMAIAADGSAVDFRLPWGAGQAGVALAVSASPFQCFQLDSLTDDDGGVYVPPGQSGAYCTSCDQRVSVAAGGGLFVVPSRAGSFQPAGSLHARFALRDCVTLTPATPATDGGAPPVLTLKEWPLGPSPARGTVRLRVIVTPASVFYPSAADSALDAALAAVNDQLSVVGITATWAEPSRLPAAAGSDATFSRGDPSPLVSLRGGDPGDEASIPVVLAGCLLLSDPLVGTPSEPLGYTPHIPGGAGPADAVYIKGSPCGTPQPIVENWTAEAFGRVAAHEIGHYLGLYHAVEADGTMDQLPDTDAGNLMNYDPTVSTATGLTPEQGEVMRRHPFVSSMP